MLMLASHVRMRVRNGDFGKTISQKLAAWVQMAVRESAADMQAALDAEDYEEAAALQQDCDTAEADAATLRTEHGFQASG